MNGENKNSENRPLLEPAGLVNGGAILVVEDEADILEGLTLLLSEQGYSVVTASDGIQALDLINKQFFPIALLDLKLPGVDGLEILKRIKGKNSETEVIIITGHGDIDSAITALKLEASDFIPKPFKTDSIFIALKRAREKISLRAKLKEYTSLLENKYQAAAEEIVRREEFESRLVQSSLDAIIASDGEGKIVFYNQAAENIFTYSRNEVLQRMKTDDLYPPPIAGEIKNYLQAIKSPEDTPGWKEIEVRNKRGDSIPVRFSGNVIIEKGKIIGNVVFFHDLRQLKKLEQDLVQSERLAAIGQTTAGIAHYIKGILTGLEGGIFIAKDALKQKDLAEIDDCLQMLERNVGRISGLTYDLLSFSKEREPAYQDVCANEIAEDVCSLFEHNARDNEINLIRDFDPALPPVPLDPQGIHSALLNLVSNAIDACTEDTGEDQLEIRVKTSHTPDALVLAVSDNGIGMDSGVKNNLFTSFFSTKGGRGTGLGLLTTQKIVHEHNGRIKVESEKGKGSTFTITLPKKVIRSK